MTEMSYWSALNSSKNSAQLFGPNPEKNSEDKTTFLVVGRDAISFFIALCRARNVLAFLCGSSAERLANPRGVAAALPVKRSGFCTTFVPGGLLKLRASTACVPCSNANCAAVVPVFGVPA